MTEDKEKEPKKRRSALSLVSRKSTKKMLGKWKKLESSEKDEVPESSPRLEAKLCGLSIEDACRLDPSLDGVPLPVILRQCVDYVNEYGLDMEGIYRVSSPKSRLDELERTANHRADPAHYDPSAIPDFRDAHEAAGLLKRFLRQIPHPLFPSNVDQIVDECKCDWRAACVCGVSTQVNILLRTLPPTRRLTLAYIFIHAQMVVSRESDNKMGIPALGLLLQTILDMPRRVVCLMMANATPLLSGNKEGASFLFTDVVIQPYVAPLTREQVENWQCEDKPSIEMEMGKQNALLEHLHGQVAVLPEGPSKTLAEEHLWGVQQGITSLRRRLRTVVEPTRNDVDQTDTQRVQMYEEKQLLAVQSMLREDIQNEERRIAELCWKIISAGVDPLKEDLVEAPRTDEVEWKEMSFLEEAAREALVNEVSKLRTECAVLRASLEMNPTNNSPPIVTRF